MWDTAKPGLAALILVATTIGAGEVMAIERADYTVIAEYDEFELRRYQAQILVETEVEADFDDAGNLAFRRLFGYISGDNRSRSKISMTAPVTQQAPSEKISMTAPVTQRAAGSSYRVAFLVPSAYTMDTVPEPTDDRVELRQVPERTVAALRFSGGWAEKRFTSREARLLQLLRDNGLRPASATIYARYNAPFTPWFMRRNEVLIPVEDPTVLGTPAPPVTSN
jgi:hypothetical protein